jgi:putative Mg2+ transporter-C (MgtC) family protein
MHRPRFVVALEHRRTGMPISAACHQPAAPALLRHRLGAAMPLNPSFADLALRVLLTIIACAAIGFERGESGKAAGLRTTLLVGLAACLAMLQVNLLLPVAGKASDSFVVMDLMRLPLGILSGVGFIGAGAILRRNNMVIGVTTAATMWYVTVLGLCFGGGQMWLGIAGTLLGVVVIQGLRIIEPQLPRDRQSTLTLRYDRARIDSATLMAEIVRPPFSLLRASSSVSGLLGTGELRLRLRWRALDRDHELPALVETLGARQGVQHVEWDAGGIPGDG